MSELDSTKARLRLLEQNVVNKDGGASGNSVKSEVDNSKSQQQQQIAPNTSSAPALPPHKSENSSNHRVHFDLNNATSAEIRQKPARTSRPNGATVSTRPANNVHLPSDARQKLEQLVLTYTQYGFIKNVGILTHYFHCVLNLQIKTKKFGKT